MSSNVFMTLAELAHVHADGSYSIVRGGIGGLVVAQLPGGFQGFLFVEVGASALEPGQYEMFVEIDDGETVQRSSPGRLVIRDTKQPARMALPVVLRATRAVAHRIRFAAGDARADIGFEVTQAPA